MTNIYDLVNLLRNVRSRYQAEFIDATETKKKELELLKSGYIPGSKPYLEKEQEIELNFDVAIVRAREKAAKKAAEEIENMKEWEIFFVSSFFRFRKLLEIAHAFDICPDIARIL